MSLSLAHRLEQDDERVTLRVDIPRGVSPKSLDVSITDLCVTVNAPPRHVLNVDLSRRVALEGYRCMFKGGVLTILLRKERPGPWESIEFDGREFSEEAMDGAEVPGEGRGTSVADGQQGVPGEVQSEQSREKAEGTDGAGRADRVAPDVAAEAPGSSSAPSAPLAGVSKERIQERRDSSFKRYQAYLAKKRQAEQVAAARERRRQLEADYELRLQKKREEEQARERRVSAIRAELLDERDADLVVQDSSSRGGAPRDPAAHGAPQMPTIRNADTVYISSKFTQRRMAVPAREGRDIYVDAALGPSQAELSASKAGSAGEAPGKQYNDVTGDARPPLSPYELLDKARELAGRGPRSDFSSAIQAAQAALEQAPLFMDALVLLASLLLHENRSEEVLERTEQALLAFEGRHPLQAARRGPDGRPAPSLPERLSYSRALQSQVHSLRGAAHCQLRQYREGLISLDTALLLAGSGASEGLRRDRDLLQGIVEAL